MSDFVPPLPQEPAELPPVEVFYYEPRRRRIWLNILLLVLTFCTTLVVGARLELNFQSNLPAFSGDADMLPLIYPQWILHEPRLLLLGLPFSLCLMGILLAHEMGHYLYCVRYKVSATLPFFIPAPTFIGTLGAFIRIRGLIRSRAALFDIGIAGPIAGFVATLPVLFWGLSHSRWVNVPAHDTAGVFGMPLAFEVIWRILHPGAHSPALASVYLHPVAIAAWVGLFATSLNLLPGGQLDGGHIVFAVWPKAHRWVTLATILALLPMAVFCSASWLIWAVMVGATGLRHPDVPAWTQIDAKRKWLALLAVAMLALSLIPAPFTQSSLIDSLPERWQNQLKWNRK
ncbi:MAG TPA: site-2 protease family protein [candidate division Zixibacteria bacterium]|nr:site-2 protease family protein [candidate division Zixibacteria bacterium]